MSVISTTDYWAARQRPMREALDVLVRARNGPELGVRERRILELATTGTVTERPMVPIHPLLPTTRRPRSTAEEVDFRPDAPARYEIRLGRGAEAVIVDEVRMVFQRFGRIVEVGGYLHGLQRPRLAGATVCHASDAGPSSRHAPTEMRLSQLEEVEAELPEFLRHLKIAGDWHSQPTDGEPSAADMRGWRGQLEESGWDRWLGVIASPGGLGWTHPTLTGWLTSRHRDHFICEPAKVLSY